MKVYVHACLCVHNVCVALGLRHSLSQSFVSPVCHLPFYSLRGNIF